MEIRNKSAFYEYYIEDKYDAGMMLTGTEVKSLREGKASFNDSYCLIHKGELWLKSLHISEYSHGTNANHDPLRERKLLVTKKELKNWTQKLKKRVIPSSRYAFFLVKKGLQKSRLGWEKEKSFTTKEKQ